MGESPDCPLLSGTVVSENPDHVCWDPPFIPKGGPSQLPHQRWNGGLGMYTQKVPSYRNMITGS